MANISTFDAPAGDTLRPTDRAADTAREAGMTINRFARETGAAIGGAVGRVGGQIGEAVDNHIAGQMIGHGAVVSSQLMATLTKQIDDTMSQADPNDLSAGQGQRENVDKSLQAFQDQFADAPQKVQDWALQTTDHLRTHFGNSITAHEMSRASGAAELNMRNTVRANANTVDLDPASLAGTIAKQKLDFDSYISTHTLPPGAVNELRKELDKANGALAYTAAQSIGKKNPDGLFKLLADGAYDKWLDPEQKERLEKFARSEQGYQHEQKQWAYMENKRALDEAAKTAHDDYITKLLNHQNPGNFQADPRLAGFAEMKENIKGFQHRLIVEARDRADTTPHPQNLRSIIDQVDTTFRTDPAGLTSKPIFDAYKRGELNIHEFDQALAVYKSIDTPLERQYRASITRVENLVGASFEGAQVKKLDANLYADALNRFEMTGRQAIANATTPEERKRLSDPLSKDYVFSGERFSAMLPNAPAALKTGADAERKKEAPRSKEIAGKIVKSFPDEAAVRAAKLPDGSVVSIGGKKFVWTN